MDKEYAPILVNHAPDFDNEASPGPSKPPAPVVHRGPDRRAIAELTEYFYARFRAAHGTAYRQNWPKDTKLIEAAMKRYPGEMRDVIDYLFDEHQGVYGPLNKRSVQGTGLFAANASWLADQLFYDMHQARRRKDEYEAECQRGDVLHGDEWLAMMQGQ